MHFRNACSALLLACALAGCGGDDTTTVTVRETVTETSTSSVPSEAPAVLAAFMLRDGKVEPASRQVVAGAEGLEAAALDALLEGPTAEEAQAGLESAIPEGTTRGDVEIDDDLAIVGLTPEPRDAPSRAQVVYTLTELPNVKRVSFGGGTPVRRARFEAQTPAILVLSPLPGEEVEPGFEATGTANTFEATFQYELRDASDAILTKNFVTATSGTGTRGTFRLTVPYEVGNPQEGRLVVFELSAADGSRTNERSTALQLR